MHMYMHMHMHMYMHMYYVYIIIYVYVLCIIMYMYMYTTTITSSTGLYPACAAQQDMLKCTMASAVNGVQLLVSHAKLACMHCF